MGFCLLNNVALGARYAQQHYGLRKIAILDWDVHHGTGEDRYLQAFDEEIVPALETFSPDLLMVSAGFDAHMNDPLADMNLTDASYAAMTWRVDTTSVLWPAQWNSTCSFWVRSFHC